MPQPRRIRNQGFTLIELMIVVVVIAVLASIAIPSYQDYVRRSKLNEATAGLAELRLRAEKRFADNRTYAGTSTTITGARYFTFSCPTLDATSFLCQAQGVTTEGVGAFLFKINQDNTKSTTITGLSGWSSSSTCWVTKKGETC